MCRMLGIVARSGIDATLLRDFRTLAKEGRLKDGSRGEHPTGWGVIYFEGDSPIYAGRRPESAWRDIEEYERACRAIDKKRPMIVIAHVRKAPPETCSVKNTHPFIKDGWCFAHNGTIHYGKEQLKGRIDSEKFFDDVIAEMENGESIKNAISAVRQVAEKSRDEHGEGYSSLTFLMADASSLYAYREYTSAPDYYTMLYHSSPEIAVATQETEWLSQKMPEAKWRELGNRELLIVDAKTMKAKRVRIK